MDRIIPGVEYMNGMRTSEFSRVVPEQYVAAVFKTQEDIILLNKMLDNHRKLIESQGRWIETLRQDQSGVNKDLLERLDYLEARVSELESLQRPILQSRLLRFLNIFGHWYTYDSNDYMSPREHRQTRYTGKPSLIGRIQNFCDAMKEWFSHRPKFRKENDNDRV